MPDSPAGVIEALENLTILSAVELSHLADAVRPLQGLGVKKIVGQISHDHPEWAFGSKEVKQALQHLLATEAQTGPRGASVATADEQNGAARQDRSKLEEVLCSEADGLKLNRVTLHFDDAEDVAALLQVNKAIRAQLTSLALLEGDEESAEDPRELWHAMCKHKATALGVKPHHFALRHLISKAEEWNAADDDRPDWLCADLADDPIVYSRVLGAAVPLADEPPLASFRRFAAVVLVADQSRVLRTLFNLKDPVEARELRDSLLDMFAAEMAGLAGYRADELSDPPEEREREEELQAMQQSFLALLVCTLASLAPMLHDNLETFGDTQISGRYLHLALVGSYLSRPGHFHTVGEDGRPSKAFPLNDAVTPEVTLAVDALTLLVWWPQFRAHTAQMRILRQSLSAITAAEPDTKAGKLRAHAHLDDLCASLAAADHYAETGSPFPASRRRQRLGGKRGVRLEEQPYVAAVLRRAGVQVDEL